MKFSRSPIAGFTLIETLTVLVIAGILAAIAAPSWQGIAAARRAEMAQNEILQTLRQAQQQASRSRRSQTVTFTTASPPTIQINSQPPVQLGQASTQNQQQPPLGLRISGSSETAVEFDSRGAVSRGVGMVITATSPPQSGKRRCVIVETLLGALRTGKDNECGSM